MISASKVNKDLGVAIVTEQGETPLLMSRCQSQATIWAVSDKPALLRKLLFCVVSHRPISHI